MSKDGPALRSSDGRRDAGTVATVATPPMPPDVAAAFDALASGVRRRLIRVRALIFRMAAQTATAPLTETLKWGEPAYLTDRCRTGTTIRLGCVKGPERAAVLFHCRTTLIAEFRDQFGDVFEFEGSRALILPHEADFDPDALAICIARALTYHRDKRKPTL